ncbi:hypothetical protein [Turicibacter sanguinis]|uniref:hypothetical protein n=1 Tax=Turicibacter sanguinis TaxID=154288 RepID=UPI00294356D6|nr:hypothetical protein [Turicibacter sanguinis]
MFNSTYPDELAYKLVLYNKKHELKKVINLYGKDTGEKLFKELHEVSYEIGDFIQLFSSHSPETLKITGELTGDVSLEQENYADGVQNQDYIDNVRFQIQENKIVILYNQQPVFKGLEDYYLKIDEDIDPLIGITVIDDHDGLIDLSKIKVKELQNNDSFVEYEYIVADSWERRTIGKRIIYKKTEVSFPEINQSDIIGQDVNKDDINIEDLIPIERPNAETLGEPAYVLVNEMKQLNYRYQIIVDGIRYTSGTTKRLIIGIDENNILRLAYQDGLLFNPSVKGSYFKLGVYNSNMDQKLFVEVLGTDRSDSTKLAAIDGFQLAEGDYIYIWMYEPETNLKMTGRIQFDENIQDFTEDNLATRIPASYLENHRFKYMKMNLESVENQAPEFKALPPINTSRGQDNINFLDILGQESEISQYITDDHETFNESSYKRGDVQLTYTEVDFNRAGIQEITYTATDKWGSSSTAKRQVIVTGDAPLDKTSIQIYTDNLNQDATKKVGLTITFDYISKTINITKANDVEQLNPNNTDMQFRLRIYSKDGILKKNFTIKGTDQLTSQLLSNLNNYNYSDGDQISLSTSNLENVSIIAPYQSNVETEGTFEQNNEYLSDLQTYKFNQDTIKNGRLELKGNALGYIYNNAPRILWSNQDATDETIIVNRGENINYEDYLTVIDEIDNGLGIKTNVKVTSLDTTQLGDYQVKYQATDSWGRTSAKIINIQIVEKNELEKANFIFKDLTSNTDVLKISFDDIGKHLVAQSLRLDSVSDNKLFSLQLYDKFGELRATFEVNNTTNLDELNGKFKEITYENTDMLHIIIHSTNYSVSFNNYKIYQKEQVPLIEELTKLLHNGTFSNDDEMRNTRFVLNEKGLIKVNNKENPGIKYNDLENILPAIYIVKDTADITESTFYDNIKIIDYLYGELNNSRDKIKISLDDPLLNWDTIIQTVGTYHLNYTFEDTWGRTTMLTRNLFIISKASENTIKFKYDSNPFLTLKFDSTKNGFDVQLDLLSEEELVPSSQSNLTDYNILSNDVLYTLGVYDSNGNTIQKFELTSPNGTINTKTGEMPLQEIVNILRTMEIRTGYYISIWAKNPNDIEIIGNISDSTSHPIPDKSLSDDEQYKQDVMKNTRFKITDNGLEAVYNQAPNVIFDFWDTLLAGTEIPLSEGVTITDDHDTGEYADYKIDIKYQYIGEATSSNTSSHSDSLTPPSADPNVLRIGENKVIYIVTDSWGRSATFDRLLAIKNGLHRNIIQIHSSITSNESTQGIVLNLGFDNINNQLKITTDSQATIDTASNKIGLQFILYDSNGEVKFNYSRTGDQYINYFNLMNNFQFAYGDYLYIKAAQPRGVYIQGSVLNSREDYTDGFLNPLSLTSSYFQITESGLKAFYKEENSVTVTERDTIIAPVAPEEIPIQFKISPNSSGGGTIVKQNQTSNQLWSSAGSTKVFAMYIYRKNENGIYEIAQSQEVNGNTKGHSVSWDNFTYKDGDYLVLWHKYPHMLTLYGNTFDTEGNTIDFTNGIAQTEQRDLVFRLQDGKVIAEYNYAPQITGLGDSIDILESQVEEFKNNHGFTNRMTINDDRDSILMNADKKLYVTIEPIDNDNLRTTASPLGSHRVRYTVTDTWGRSTSYDITINVRTNVSNNYFNVKSYDNAEQVLFKLGFDSITQQYVVFDQVQNQFTSNSDLAYDEVLTINIRGKDGTSKANISLLGSDRGTSSKLDKLNTITYDEDDLIRISSLKFTNSSMLTGEGYTINGIISYPQGNIGEIQPLSPDSISDNIQPLPDDINVIDYLKNIGYILKTDNLIAYYNYAPTIKIDSDTENTNDVYKIYKGSTYNRSIFTADDIEDGTLTNQIKVYINGNLITENSYTFNILGEQQVRLQVTDSWGRTTTKVIIVNVKSKMENNQIEIGTGTFNKTFAITFNIETEKIELKPINGNILENSEDNAVIEQYAQNSSSNLTIILRNLYGIPKAIFNLTGDYNHDLQMLKNLNQQGYKQYDTLEFKTTNPQLVKIKGFNPEIINIETQRYQITDYGLNILSKPTVSVKLKEIVTVKRGDNVNLFEEINVTGLNPNSKDLRIKEIKVVAADLDSSISPQYLHLKSNDNIFPPKSPELVIDSTVEGIYTINTVFVDSWENEIIAKNKVEIVPRDAIDSIKFKVKNGDQEVITLALDSINNKMRVVKEPSITNSLLNSSILTTITGYDLVGNKVSDIVVKSDSTAESLQSSLDLFRLDGIESISVISSDSINIDVIGDITLSDSLIQQQNKLFVRDKQQDLMNNTRLVLDSSTNSVNAVYNQAPKILGIENVITYYNGSVKNFNENLTVMDDLDGEIFSSNIDYDDSNIDYDSLTRQNIQFTVSDSWGRKTVENGQVLIRSGLEKSSIELHPLNKEDGSVIEILFVNNKITVQQQNSSTKKYNIFQRFVKTITSFLSSESDTAKELNSSSADSKGLEITLFNQDTNEVRVKALITSYETAQSEFEKLHNVFIRVGDQLSIKAVGLDDNSDKKSELYQNIKINGPIVNKKEDYTNGVNNIENLDNVRFKISTQGLESIYNESPKIYFQIDNISYYLGDEVNFNYGLLIRDDHDGLINSGYNVELTGIYVDTMGNKEINSNETVAPSMTLVPVTDDNYFVKIGDDYYPRDEGIYQFTYTVKDSWGRESIATRAIELKNALHRNIMTFANRNREQAMYINFSLENRRILANAVSPELSNVQIADGHNETGYYKFRIFNSLGEAQTDDIIINSNATIQQYINSLNTGLQNYTFEYGDYIKVYAGHPKKFGISTIITKDPLKISGTLVNGREDYSDGIDIASNITDSVFVITSYGLVSNYSDPLVQENSNFDILSWTSPEKVAANLKINRDNYTFSFVGENRTQYKSQDPDKVVFTVTLYDGHNGSIKYTAKAKGQDKSQQGAGEFFTNFNNQTWRVGDYLEISTTEPKRIALRGNIIGARENYSDGVDMPSNLSKARFILTNSGIKAVYMDPPLISGVQDYEIKKGTAGVTKDSILQHLRQTVTAVDIITGEQLPVIIDENNFNFDVNQIGYYNVNYTATTTVSNKPSLETKNKFLLKGTTSKERSNTDNSDYSEINQELSTTKSSTITVYAVPQFKLKNGGVIEMNSIENNKQAIESYLTEFVEVTDEEDDAIGLKINPVITSNNVNPTKPGTYDVTYKAEDSDGHENIEVFTNKIQVVRTISVSIPVKIPFQVVTNLLGDNGEQVDPQFMAGIINIQNNNPTPVAVYLKSFNVINPSDANGSIADKLSLVLPTEIDESSMTIEDSMTKMALGLYVKSGFDYDANEFEYKNDSINESVLSTSRPNPDAPIWLLDNGFDISYVPSILNTTDRMVSQQPFYFGTLAPSTDKEKSKAQLSFNAKFGNNVVSGKSRAKFQMVLEFR